MSNMQHFGQGEFNNWGKGDVDLPSPKSENFQNRVREEIHKLKGKFSASDRALTVRDALNTGLLVATSGGGLAPGVADYVPDLNPPPQPTGFVVDAAISHIFIEHATPTYTQGNGHMRAVVYGATVSPSLPNPVFSDAVEIAQFSGTVFAYPTNPATTWRLWIKWQSNDGVLSATPAGGTNGLEAITAQDPTKLVQALTGPGNPFKVVDTAYTLPDGTPVPAGTYTSDAYMGSFVAARGQIGLLAVDDARIASLNVSKLVAGSIAVGQYIQSTDYVAGSAGWRINGDGTAEFSGVVVRGTVFATAGQIGGSTIDSTGMQSPGYVAGSAGWRLKSNGDIEVNAGTFRGTLDVKSAATNARLEIKNNVIKVFDAAGTLRVQIGDLTA